MWGVLVQERRFRVWGLGFKVQGLTFWIFRFRVEGLGFKDQRLGSMSGLMGLRCRVQQPSAWETTFK